ncbi:peptidoglycan-recognition protein SB2 isoform X2 [Drosophila erecta]|uniref:peptidoglycan-recognition protein SB2 isoform X2 n=1 Tax=Drosophila erecta TaxID=7220 RepID=UPI000F0474E0|nr:peptidoglycan-recognition protein SB2 isoform X2 [Drosophila erecta]
MKLQLALVLCGLTLALGQIVPRSSWCPVPLSPRLPRLVVPVRLIIIHHTVTAPCFNPQQCQLALRRIRADHMRRKFRDIGYNFLIGGDGRIYEGLGFGIRGEHAPHYNSQSIGIAFIGNFQSNWTTSFANAAGCPDTHPNRRAASPGFAQLFPGGSLPNKGHRLSGQTSSERAQKVATLAAEALSSHKSSER